MLTITSTSFQQLFKRAISLVPKNLSQRPRLVRIFVQQRARNSLIGNPGKAARCVQSLLGAPARRAMQSNSSGSSAAHQCMCSLQLRVNTTAGKATTPTLNQRNLTLEDPAEGSGLCPAALPVAHATLHLQVCQATDALRVLAQVLLRLSCSPSTEAQVSDAPFLNL